jgi:hypothetical protein
MRNCKVSTITLREAQKKFQLLVWILKNIFSVWQSFPLIRKVHCTAWQKLCQDSERNQKLSQSSCLGLIVIYKSLCILFPISSVIFGRKSTCSKKIIKKNYFLKDSIDS